MTIADAVARFADLLAEPLLVVTASGAVALANRSARERLHIEPDGPVDLFQLVTVKPDDVACYLKLCARSADNLPGSLTLRTKRDVEGTTFHCTGRSFADGNGGRLILLHLVTREASIGKFVSLNQRIEALTREVSLRLRAERTLDEQREVLRVTLASIGDAMITTDMAGRVTFMNAMAETATGWKQAAALGRPLETVFNIRNEETDELVNSPVATVIARGVTVGLANHTVLIRKDGTRLPIDDTAAPIRSNDGTMLGVVLVFHDVGDRRRLERELLHQALALKEADRRKDEFLAMLGHELRNPLATLRNCVHILGMGGNAGHDQTSLARMMARQTEHLAKLVDDLLDISRITRGIIRLDKKPVTVAAVIEHALETTRAFIDECRHEIQLSLPSDEVRVEGDLLRLSQALANLLANAAKFTPKGGRISVEGSAVDGRASIRVRDTGVGIRQDLLPFVFDLFRQADRGLDRSQGGLGIGLTVARNLAQMHGGDIEAFSAGLGKGSEFVFSLPLTDAPLTAGTKTETHEARLARKVLIVDDNRDAASSLATIVASWGCAVSTTEDGASALEQTMRDVPDVILLDIGLPGMDGYEVARRLRARPRTAACKIIAVSGYGADQDKRRAHAAGVDEHLTKPVDLGRLRELVGR